MGCIRRGGGISPGEDVRPPLKSPTLQVSYARMTAIKGTRHAPHKDSQTPTHCHDVVTELCCLRGATGAYGRA